MSESKKAAPKWVQYAVDYTGLAALVIGFIVTKDLLKAGWWLAVGSAVGLVLGLVMQKRLALLPLFTGISAVFFAGLSLIFHDTIFLKLKLTIVDTIFAAGLLGGLALGKQPLKALLGEALALSDQAWKKLTFRYGLFFVFLAVVNLAVWWFGDELAKALKMTSDAVWVAFRFPGVPLMTVVFSLTQAPLLMKELSAAEAEKVPPPPAS